MVGLSTPLLATPVDAQIGLGANLGEPLRNCQQALLMLDKQPHVTVTACSSWYRTEPLGPQQPDYINGAATLTTTLSPLALLALLLDVEQQMGRDRHREQRWGPRALDLDLLFYADLLLDHPQLILPHPQLHLRRFVLQPLGEIIPTKRHPKLGKTVDTLLSEVEDRGQVERLS
ncbi:2-amino-4-hydroxy-6-hydroxymethyldihydropteridine diphosphokinase [Magnetococcus marinus]|uniref:2-amino-4-hydroxy-6- hydroxymethyldihydropteridine diphosphokinase n=1 Tax=Magnetococcus marinus TaxID=1124597 RepID=UPI0006747AC8